MIYLAITTISAEHAAAFARRLVEDGLAACVNIVPGVRSIYRWEGKLCDDAEVVLLIKTSPRTVGGFEERFLALHPYTTPELLLIPVEEGLKSYFEWVEEVCGPQPPAPDEDSAARDLEKR
ncbi:MAG: divalent-cation tolerance protein CutA [Planctomycetota bacterium]